MSLSYIRFKNKKFNKIWNIFKLVFRELLNLVFSLRRICAHEIPTKMKSFIVALVLMAAVSAHHQEDHYNMIKQKVLSHFGMENFEFGDKMKCIENQLVKERHDQIMVCTWIEFFCQARFYKYLIFTHRKKSKPFKNSTNLTPKEEMNWFRIQMTWKLIFSIKCVLKCKKKLLH